MYDNHHLLDIDTLMVADELENVFYFCQRTALGLNSPANLTLDIHVDRIRLRPGAGDCLKWLQHGNIHSGKQEININVFAQAFQRNKVIFVG
ncbi:MAG: hypothetical protein ACJAXR_001471 [Halopseudomonas sp.]|jgi:hypothetical protein|uniref:hypothetical protein n=1 Tax=Halopseudomonas sp. TaxID=2901191 RepID=UPI0039E3DBD3